MPRPLKRHPGCVLVSARPVAACSTPAVQSPSHHRRPCTTGSSTLRAAEVLAGQPYWLQRLSGGVPRWPWRPPDEPLILRCLAWFPSAAYLDVEHDWPHRENRRCSNRTFRRTCGPALDSDHAGNGARAVVHVSFHARKPRTLVSPCGMLCPGVSWVARRYY